MVKVQILPTVSLKPIVCVRFPASILTFVNPCPTTRKPFDMLIEGLYSETNRGDSTPIELFLEGVSVWEPGIRRLLSAKAVSEK
jgi:hypothetical protein